MAGFKKNKKVRQNENPRGRIIIQGEDPEQFNMDRDITTFEST
jgi:hypothetical protein